MSTQTITGQPEVLPPPDFRALFESAPGLYLVLDPDLKIVAVSNAYLRATLTRREAVLGRGILEVFPGNPDDPQATGARNLNASLRRVLRDRAADAMPVQKYDIRRPADQGGGFEERYWSLVNTPVLGPGGEVAYVIHRVEDVTEPQRRQGELFRLMVENTPDYAIFVTDAEGRVQTWSPAAQALLGYREEEVVGQPADRFFTPEDRRVGAPARERQQALARGHAEEERWYVRGDGSRLWARATTTALRGPGRQVRGFAKVLRDSTDRKQAEEARAEAQAYAESIVETVREPLLVLDADMRVWTANRSFYQTFHVTPEETRNRSLYELGNRQWDIPGLREMLQDVLPRDTAFNDYEVVHDFEAIGPKVMLLNGRRIRRKDGRRELILLAIEDVTERRRAEERRRELETRFTSLVKNIKEHAIFTLGPDGKIASWNVEAERILGYAEAEVLGRSFALIFTPEDVAQGLPDLELRTALAQGRAEDERWHLRKNGERFWALGIVTPTRDAHGNHTGFAKILRDMTDRKRAEEQVRFQADVLDRVEQAVIVTDPDGRVIYWNRFAERLYGWPREEAIGRNVGELLVTPAEAGRAAEIMASLRAGRNWSGEFPVRRRDGTTFPALVSDTPMVDGDGRLRAIIGISADITERKRLEEQLRLRVGELAEADRRKDEFLAMLAHELRNPLAPIRTGLDRMRLKLAPGSDLHPVLDVVERQLGQMTRLVDDLLDVSRITRGQIPLHKERVDLHAVITQAVETARPLLDACRHDLTYAPPPEALALEADPTRLAQALSNVLSNAARYTEKGGRVWLTAGREGAEAVVRVRDNGIGIEPEMLPRVFDLFTQAPQAEGQSSGGLGIGLAVVRRLVEMHGGSVTAHSAGRGRGSEFVLRLPLGGEDGGAAPEGGRDGARRPGATAARRRILLVDDLVEVAEDMAALVREAFGHEVRTAHDGPTALRVAAEFRPELVLLDIGLPGMSGCEVARRLREVPGLGAAVLVALTGWGQEEDRRKTREAGFNDHLVKPVGLKELQRLLAEMK